MTNLFVTNDSQEATAGINQLEKTAQLTSQASTIANSVLKVINAVDEDQKAEYEGMVKASMTNHDEMDDLINACVDLADYDIDYLKKETESTLDKMVKSQQSKRSRSKGKVMTLDNYKTMLVGAIAENLLRMAAGKPKLATGASSNGSVVYSVEELTKLSMSKEELAKAIRNVQSKKSIAKSKIGFSVDSDKWQQLLVAEQQLKALRDGTVCQKPIVDARLFKLETALKEVSDPSALKGNDAKALLAMMLEIINQTETVNEEETTADESTTEENNA
jgi:hypothetical protein